MEPFSVPHCSFFFRHQATLPNQGQCCPPRLQLEPQDMGSSGLPEPGPYQQRYEAASQAPVRPDLSLPFSPHGIQSALLGEGGDRGWGAGGAVGGTADLWTGALRKPFSLACTFAAYDSCHSSRTVPRCCGSPSTGFPNWLPSEHPRQSYTPFRQSFQTWLPLPALTLCEDQRLPACTSHAHARLQ